MKVVIEIKKKVRNARCLPKEAGRIEFRQEDLERIALEVFRGKTNLNEEKFEYSAHLTIITVD